MAVMGLTKLLMDLRPTHANNVNFGQKPVAGVVKCPKWEAITILENTHVRREK